MKRFSIYLIVLIVLTNTYAGWCYASILDESIIDDVVKAITVELKESEVDKSYIEGDLNQDGAVEVIILLTVEAVGGGANNYSQYLLVLYEIQNNGSLKIVRHKVGGKTSRNLELSSISDGVLVLNSYFVKPTDPFCCPSGEQIIYFSFTNNNLKEHKSFEEVYVERALEVDAGRSLEVDVKRLLLLHNKTEEEAQYLFDNTTVSEQIICTAELLLPFSLYFKSKSFEEHKPDWFTNNSIEQLRLDWVLSSFERKTLKWRDISVTLNRMSTPSWIPVSHCDSRWLYKYFMRGQR